ncbi:MAG: hypothetical protein QM666_01280 [Acinetobacter sp.]
MRQLICAMGLLATLLPLSGCGQSGVLQLPSDPNLDTRPKYLLYRHHDQQNQVKQDAVASEPSSSNVQ